MAGSSSWARRVFMAAALALVAVAAACGDDDDGGGGNGDASAGDRAFCQAWDDAFAAGDDAALQAALGSAPAELEDAAERLLARPTSPPGQPSDPVQAEAATAAKEVTVWVEANCHTDVAAEDAAVADRRVAVPAGSTPADLVLCGVVVTPDAEMPRGTAVLYGDTTQGDPYDGPMLGVFFGSSGGDHSGDGDATPVQVRGVEGVSAPITVFQQVIPEGLGTVIAWEEDGRPMGLYGRFWEASRTDELVALADALEVVDGGYRLPGAALPDGYAEVYSGTTAVFDLIFTVEAGYQVRYQVDGDPRSSFALRGQVQEDLAAFEALRFFSLPGMERSTDGDREVLSGNPWGELGPQLVTWREPDGLVVRVIGIGEGGTPERVRALADATRELDRDEWLELLGAEDECEEPTGLSGAAR